MGLLKKSGYILVVVFIIGVMIWWNYRQTTQTVSIEDLTKEETLVGVVMNGSIDDENWSQSHYEGLESIREELNLKICYQEDVQKENVIRVIEDFINQNINIIIVTCCEFEEEIEHIAPKYPEVYFFHAGGLEQEKNVLTYYGKMYQMRYLTGIVAGLQTQTDTIGYVAAMPVPEVIRGINAFTLGARSVNPEVKVYVEWTNSWINKEATKNITLDLINYYPIDIITYHHDAFETLQIAEEQDIYSIGYNMDHSQTYQKTFLTAAVWDWQVFYREQILRCLQGKFKGGNYWGGIESGMIGIAPFTSNVKDGIAEIVEEKKYILSEGIWDVFYGPIKDQDGDVQIEENNFMTEEELLNQMNWFVEGVITP